MIAIMLGSRDLADWQAKWQGNIKPTLEPKDLAFPDLERALSICAKDVKLFAFYVSDFRLVVKYVLVCFRFFREELIKG